MMPGGRTGPLVGWLAGWLGGVRASNWLAKQPIAARLAAVTSAGSGTRRARCHGTRGSPGDAQCQVQTG